MCKVGNRELSPAPLNDLGCSTIGLLLQAPAIVDAAAAAGAEGGANADPGAADAAAAAAMGVDGGLPAPLALGGNQLPQLLQSLGMPASLNISGLPAAGGAGDAAGRFDHDVDAFLYHAAVVALLAIAGGAQPVLFIPCMCHCRCQLYRTATQLNARRMGRGWHGWRCKCQ